MVQQGQVNGVCFNPFGCINTEIWSKKLTDEKFAVLFFNKGGLFFIIKE